MSNRTSGAVLAALTTSASALAETAFARSVTMRGRSSGANAAAYQINPWNSARGDTIGPTTIPDNLTTPKFAAGAQAGEVRFSRAWT